MIISEKQIMQLIKIAEDYVYKIAIMISNGTAYGEPEKLMLNINQLLYDIREQQSEELKVIE